MRSFRVKKTPKLYISARVKNKMDELVRQSSKEIAWHGHVEKEGDNYIWYNLVLYPQYVTAATVTPDEEEYANWVEQQFDRDPEQANKIRIHGHSHVNMSPTPSGTDMKFREDTVKNLPENDFYIFLIINKKGDFTLEIYDKETDVIFETDDIDVIIGDPAEIKRTQEWAAQAIKDFIKEKKICSTTTNQSKYSTQKTSKETSTSSVAEQWAQRYPSYWYGAEYGDY